jgi:hypothetical protein
MKTQAKLCSQSWNSTVIYELFFYKCHKFLLFYLIFLNAKISPLTKMARWPHGCRRKYSEVAVPMLVGFESHRRGRIFSKEGTSAGPWMCVYVSSGLTVGWSARVRVPSGKGAHGCINVVVYVCECEVEWAWVAGESAPEPRRIT